MNVRMILKQNTVFNDQTTATSKRSLAHPHRYIVTNNEANIAKGYPNDTINGDRYSLGLTNIHVRLVTSLLFACLPGLTQLPSMASSAAPLVASVPGTQAPATTVLSPSSINSDDLLGQRRKMDAARLTMEDYSGKRGKIPDSLKKQIDMQDRRLAICQEMSRDEWEWEQCFYYGTNNGGGAMYFDGGMFAENNAAIKTTSKATKPKIPTW